MRAFCLIFFWVGTFSTFAQINRLSTTIILATAKSQLGVQLEQEKAEYLKDNYFELPILEDVEFRTETRDFDIKQQEYRVRLTPNSYRQREALRQLHQAQIIETETEELLFLHDYLEERYTLILQHFFAENVLAIRRQQLLVFEDQLTVLRRSFNLPRFNINDLIRAEEDKQEIEREILELENVLRFTEQIFQRWTATAAIFKIDSTRFIELEQVMELARSISKPIENHVEFVEVKKELDRIYQEYRVQKSEDLTIVDYIELRYQKRNKNDVFREKFAIGAGFRLPYKNSSELDVMELKVEKLERENRLKLIEAEIVEDIKRIQQEMENQYSLYQLLESQMKDNQTAFAIEQYQKITGVSPLPLLKMKESTFKKELERQKVAQELYDLFIDLLDVSGRMSAQPYQNFLSKSLENF